jgi:gas vesicle protein
MKTEGFKASQVLWAFLGGAAAGALVTLFTAPKKGAELRALVASELKSDRTKARLVPEAIKHAATAAKSSFDTVMHQ